MKSSRIDRLWSAAHRRQVWPGLLSGAAAGAAGTTALNVITYLDIALRGRPTSCEQHTRPGRHAGIQPQLNVDALLGPAVCTPARAELFDGIAAAEPAAALAG